MSQSKPLVIGVLIFCIALDASASPPKLDGSTLKPYTNLWKVVIATKGQPRDVGTWSDEMIAAKVDGHAAFVRTQVFKIRDGSTNTMITAFDARTMRPFSSSLLTSHGDATLRRFANGKVKVIDASGDSRGIPTEQTFPGNSDAYDFNAGMYGILLVGLPLAENLSGTFTTYGPADATLEHVTYTVGKKEQVEAKPGQTVAAWVIDAHYLDAHRPEGDARMRFWIATEAPYIIKLVYEVPSADQVWTYTMT
jgi:hypothetical protein